jgi:hypothetical protein
MIYFLPERIYDYFISNKCKKILSKLQLLSKKYDSYNTLNEYILYSSIKNDDETYNELHSLVKEELANNPILLQEFELILKDNIDEDYIRNNKPLDDENYLVMLITYIDFSNNDDHDNYISYMKKFIAYFNSHKSKEYSKYIYYNYISYSIILISEDKKFITASMTEDDVVAKCINTIRRYYVTLLQYSDDKDNTNSQFCEWVCFFMGIINQLVEDKNIKIDLYPVYKKLDTFLTDDIGDYQYKNYNYGYLKFCDMMLFYLLFTISNSDNMKERFQKCKELLNKIIGLFNNGLKNKNKLVRGLVYYDKAQIIKYLYLMRKYITIIANTNSRIKYRNIIDATPEDIKFILSDDIVDYDASSYENKINNKESLIKADEESKNVSDLINYLAGGQIV